MDAFELLKADHKKVAELFDLLETASGKRKLDVFKRIKTELEVHTHIEETIFYPALEKPEETHDLTLEAYEEHKVVKTLLAELSGATSATDEWQAKAKVLRENVEHHVDEEENELFDKADDALSDEEIETLGERMAAEKARKLGQPVPKRSSAKDETKKSTAKPGILSKIAGLVGLGSGTAKKAAKKAPAKKKTAAAKSSAKAGKSSRAVASKGLSTKQGSKRASRPNSSGSSKKQVGAKTSKKSAKKRASSK
ncbi:MAG TPA: hemerythrin domain-containing protein [Pyrinomonadaceae bacterium]|jgi:hemerythrin-like domain-containing protein|nr:hemerythrin domain-containing protein [Pyrinomonadaceae bacterium]